MLINPLAVAVLASFVGLFSGFQTGAINGRNRCPSPISLRGFDPDGNSISAPTIVLPGATFSSEGPDQSQKTSAKSRNVQWWPGSDKNPASTLTAHVTVGKQNQFDQKPNILRYSLNTDNGNPFSASLVSFRPAKADCPACYCGWGKNFACLNQKPTSLNDMTFVLSCPLGDGTDTDNTMVLVFCAPSEAKSSPGPEHPQAPGHGGTNSPALNMGPH